VSTGAGGRAATLPAAGSRRAARLQGPGRCVVRFVPESPAGQVREFAFADWPVSQALQSAFAAAFAACTRPGGRVRRVGTAMNAWRTLRGFAGYLAELTSPPRTPGELTPAHLAGWFFPRRQYAGGSLQLGELKRMLRLIEGLSAEFRAALAERNPPAPAAASTASYSHGENQRILNAARHDIRAAAKRIRGNRELLRRWRDGELHNKPDQARRIGELLDYVDRYTDVPRYGPGKQPLRWVAGLGTVEQHATALHLSGLEAAAFAVLLVGLTGQNKDAIVAAPATYHRPHGYIGTAGVAIVELDKPRRGARRHMDAPLTSLPDWASPTGKHGAPAGPVDAGDGLDLRSPFGVYLLLHELAAPARQILGSDRLFAWYCSSGGGPGRPGRGLRTTIDSCLVRAWARRHDLPADAATKTDGDTAGGSVQLSVTLRRLRLTYAELAQRPVAHTDTTLANEYLARNRGNLAEYQQVVAAALVEQVDKAAARARIQTVTAQDIAEARAHPERVAARHGMDTATLQRMLAGEMETVMGACIDHTNSPHAAAGQPCRASFMLCLSCPCARATPSHLPAQVLVHDEMERRKAAVTPLRWAQRFAVPHAQLGDLLERAGAAAVADARAAVTATERELVDRFLDRELDLP
jgi:hypothetical protein